MTALYIIAGYALGAVLTWVLCVRLVANEYRRLDGEDIAAICFFALFWPVFVPVVAFCVAVGAASQRLFNYFKRRG